MKLTTAVLALMILGTSVCLWVLDVSIGKEYRCQHGYELICADHRADIKIECDTAIQWWAMYKYSDTSQLLNQITDTTITCDTFLDFSKILEGR